MVCSKRSNPLTDEEIYYLETMYGEMCSVLRKLNQRLQTEELTREKRQHLRKSIERQVANVRGVREMLTSAARDEVAA